ncbi:hypothetical protein FDENT_13116 [Fusarium denticulatum]|uniref:Uncharacterized protein n=1 Tax=Fusarium denticulatum TaxID=48507 RepID=A0A8H5WLW1_9HYPO|nr:hypothetical protein FDENT_13116 [Fusarium denticulatum]
MSAQPNSGEQCIPAEPPRDVFDDIKQKLESIQSELKQVHEERLVAQNEAAYWKDWSEIVQKRSEQKAKKLRLENHKLKVGRSLDGCRIRNLKRRLGEPPDSF